MIIVKFFEFISNPSHFWLFVETILHFVDSILLLHQFPVSLIHQ